MPSKISILIRKLQRSHDPTTRLIGADWLTEQGFALEASYFQWLVQQHLEPYHVTWNHWYVWHNNGRSFLPDVPGHYNEKELNRSTIPQLAVWQAFFAKSYQAYYSDHLIFTSRLLALSALRKAYKRVYANHA